MLLFQYHDNLADSTAEYLKTQLHLLNNVEEVASEMQDKMIDLSLIGNTIHILYWGSNVPSKLKILLSAALQHEIFTCKIKSQ